MTIKTDDDSCPAFRCPVPGSTLELSRNGGNVSHCRT
jgi:hypothetical protein